MYVRTSSCIRKGTDDGRRWVEAALGKAGGCGLSVPSSCHDECDRSHARRLCVQLQRRVNTPQQFLKIACHMSSVRLRLVGNDGSGGDAGMVAYCVLVKCPKFVERHGGLVEAGEW